MPNYTPNLNLNKPIVTEQFDIAKVTNDNADIIDGLKLASNITNTPSGSISATTVQGAINELGTEKAPLASPTFTGTVGGITKSMVGLGNVDNTSDVNKPISTATQTALNSKEATITAGTTAQYYRGDKSWQTLNSTAVGLGNVTNESKATMFTSPTFTGTVTLPSTTSIGTVSSTELGYLDGVTSAIQTQLNTKAVTTTYTATLPYTSWTGSSAPYSKAVTVSGILATDNPIVDIVQTGTYATDQTMNTNWGLIYRAVTSANTITFYATAIPTADIPIQAKVVR